MRVAAITALVMAFIATSVDCEVSGVSYSSSSATNSSSSCSFEGNLCTCMQTTNGKCEQISFELNAANRFECRWSSAVDAVECETIVEGDGEEAAEEVNVEAPPPEDEKLIAQANALEMPEFNIPNMDELLFSLGRDSIEDCNVHCELIGCASGQKNEDSSCDCLKCK